MNKVLVTGATGFIGSHCLQPLLAKGFEVHALSTRDASAAPSAIPGIIWHSCNLLIPGAAKKVIDQIKPTHLLHLAWYVVPGKLISSPENFAWVTASLELVRAFHEAGGKRVVVSGSGYEYDWNYGYCSEKLTPLAPNTVYGACKHALHLMLRSYAASVGLSLGWGRVFFLYGPNEHPDRLVSSVIRSLLQDQPAKCSHGKQIRDYMHVQDVANGLAFLLDSNLDDAVNISSGQAMTLREIVLSIGKLLEKPELVQIGALPARANDTTLVIGENLRLTSELGWKQQFDLTSGLDHTIQWWRDRLKH
jgi:nucleoside-diphosphate-sugar epimerase